jgi:hypothetical protein
MSLSISSQAQTNIITENRINKHLYFGVGYSFGFFFPVDVNDYIFEKTDYFYMTEGTADLFSNYAGRILLTYRINRTFDLSAIAEYAFAPKYIIMIGEEDIYFHFDRFSPGIVAKLHIPIGSGKHSLFVAPGVHYSFLKFEEFEANTLGGKFQTGVNLNFRKNILQPFVSFDYIKARDKSNFYYQEFELSYTGIQIGVDFSF